MQPGIVKWMTSVHFLVCISAAGSTLMLSVGRLRRITMKLHSFLLCLALIASSATSCAGTTRQTQLTTNIIQGIPCLGNPKLHSNGRIKTCILAEDFLISGHMIPLGSKIGFSKTGELDACKLGREAPIYGQALPADTRLFFQAGGRLRMFWLPSKTLIQGHLLAGPQTDGQGHRLYPNGKLAAIWLASDEEIEGIPSTSTGRFLNRLGTQRMVFFYETGRLRQAHLSRDITIQGYSFKKGEVVCFSSTGSVDQTLMKLY